MQEYEIAVVYDPGLEVDLSKAEEQVKKIIAEYKGKITSTDNWGKRKLAYEIAKNEYGIYVFYSVELVPNTLNKIESALNITDEVIRYLITRIDPKDKEKAELAKQAKAKTDDEKSISDDAKDNDKE